MPRLRRPSPLLLVAIALFVPGACSGSSSSYSLPAPVAAGAATVEKPAPVVPDDSGIPGVVAYDAKNALPHGHPAGPVTYAETPPVGGDHNPVWMNCGAYPKPVQPERAVHDLEHGAVWITYRPDLGPDDVHALEALLRRQTEVEVTIRGAAVKTNQRYVDLSPFPGLPAPIVISAWAHQLPVNSPADLRLQRFIDTFRASPKYSPEYGASCDRQPSKLGGKPQFS